MLLLQRLRVVFTVRLISRICLKECAIKNWFPSDFVQRQIKGGDRYANTSRVYCDCTLQGSKHENAKRFTEDQTRILLERPITCGTFQLTMI